MQTPPKPKSVPQINALAIVFLVKELERSRLFYADTLGLTLDRHDGYLLGKLPGGAELLFFEGEATPGTSPQVVFGLEEGGIDTAVEALATRGVQVLTPVTEAPGGWSVDFLDPDGHPLAFFQDEGLPR